MKIDFFNTPCTEKKAITSERFGICDDRDETKAYTDLDDDSKWIAVINNKKCKAITFTAIDNCITVFKKNTKDKEETCDGMLIFDHCLYLVELKIKREQWRKKARSQLKNTIRLIQNNHNIETFTVKKAIACNKKHPNFQVINAEKNKRLFTETGFVFEERRDILIE